jgi:DNA repair protein RecO (recombination protein O)
MPARVSEAFVIQTYPLQESDLIVSFLARDLGKMRGVAKRARRPKSPFGAGLERLSRVRMAYFQKETRELVSLDSCELIQSQFGLVGDYQSSVALDFLAEISEQLLPAAEPNEKFFRLLAATLEQMRSGTPGAVWLATTYFALWSLRLSGLLPELDACHGCGVWLDQPDSPNRAFFGRNHHGLFCEHCRRETGPGGYHELSAVSRALAARMLKEPVANFADMSPQKQWTRETAADLRRFLIQQIETQIERRLITGPTLEGA